MVIFPASSSRQDGQWNDSVMTRLIDFDLRTGIICSDKHWLGKRKTQTNCGKDILIYISFGRNVTGQRASPHPEFVQHVPSYVLLLHYKVIPRLYTRNYLWN